MGFFTKSTLKNIDQNVKAIASRNTAPKKFGPKLPGGQKKEKFDMMDIICGMFGLFLGETKGTKQSLAKMLSTNPKKTFYGSLKDIMEKDFKSEKKRFLFDTLLDEQKSKRHWSKIVETGINKVFRDTGMEDLNFNVCDMHKDLHEILRDIYSKLKNKNNNNVGGNIQIDTDAKVDVSGMGRMNIFSLIERIQEIDDDVFKDKLHSLSTIVKGDLKDLLDTLNQLTVKDNSHKMELLVDTVDVIIKQIIEKIPPFWQSVKNSFRMEAFVEGIVINLEKMSIIMNRTRYADTNIKKVENIIVSVNKIAEMCKFLNKNEKEIMNAGLVLGRIVGGWIFTINGKDTSLIGLLHLFIEKFNEMNKINPTKNEFESFFDAIEQAFKSIIKLPFSDLPNTKDFQSVRNLIDMLNDFVAHYPQGLDSDAQENLNVIILSLGEMIDPFKRGNYMGDAIENLVDITGPALAKLQSLIDYVEELSKLAKKLIIVGRTERLAMIGISAMDNIIDKMKTIVDKINALDINADKLKVLTDALKDLMKFILVGAAVLLTGSLIMALIDVGNLFAFAITLGSFVYFLLYGFGKAVKDVAKELNVSGDNMPMIIGAFTEGMVDFGKFVVISAATLIVGSLIMGFINPINLIAFGGILFLFVWGLLWAYAKAIKTAGEAIDMKGNKAPDIIKAFTSGMLDFGKFIMLAGTTLILGSLIMGLVNVGQLLLFVGVLSGFIFLSLFAFTGSILLIGKFADIKGGVSDVMKAMFENVTNFGKFIVLCSIVLLLGSAIAKYIPWEDLLKFTGALALFIAGVILPFAIMGKYIKATLDQAKGFALLVMMAGATLLFGGMFFTIWPNLIVGTGLFATVLWGFIFGISFAYRNFRGAQIGKNALAFMALVALSGAILIFAAWVMTKEKGIEWKIALFATVFSGFVIAMSFALKQLDNVKISGRAILALGMISVSLLIASFAFKQIANIAATVGGWENIGKMAVIAAEISATMGIVGVMIVALASLLGNGITTTAAYLAIGVLIAAAGAIWIVVDSFSNIVDTLKKLEDLKKIDISALVHNLRSITEIVEALGPLAGHATEIMAVSLALTTMGIMMDKLADSVQHYASLEVPIYKGKNVVGYRKLQNSDFSHASRNISLIITTIGSAVIKTYEKNPEIFSVEPGLLNYIFGRSKFSMVVSSLKTLAPLIERIAKSVKNYASLKIPIYEGTKVVGYRTLDRTDFKDAGNNVKSIISTLGKAIIEAYEEHPDYYAGGDGNWFSEGSKFTQTVTSNMTLAKLLTKISKAVKDYASMQIPEDYKWDSKSGKLIAKNSRPLRPEDFSAAADNVKTIISTLGGAIVQAYDLHPDYYAGGDGNWFNEGSKFTQTVTSNMTLANLLTKIARAVKDYASMQVPEDYEWDPKSGKLIAKKSRPLTSDDFRDASMNVTSIISTLGEAIVKAYDAHPDYYDGGDGNWFSNGSKFTQTVKSNLTLAKLLTGIASAVKDYANLTVTDFKVDEKTGEIKPINVRHLTPNDFKDASQNVQKVLDTLGKAICEEYEKHKDRYDTTGIAGFLGWGGSSPYTRTIEANLKLADLIGGIAKSVKDYAYLTITEYEVINNEIKPKTIRHLSSSDFSNAAENVQLIISTLGKSIMETYEQHEDWFDDGEDSPFAMASKAIGSMAEMITNIATGIQNYANLKMPNWSEGVDENGNPKAGYQQLDDNVFKKAGEHIQLLIGTVGSSLIEFHDKHPDYFDDGEDSTFMIVTNATAKMGEMISSMSSAITSYADLKIPIDWNPEDGTPTKFRSMTDDEITKAGKNISKIISTVGCAIIALYNGQTIKSDGNNGITFEDMKGVDKENVKQMFQTSKDDPDSIFYKVITSCSEMGTMISDIAEGIQFYASLNVPKYENGKLVGYATMDDTDFKKAADNISLVITTIGGALIETFNEHTELFKTSKKIIKTGGFLGLCENEIIEGSDETPFELMLRSVGQMGSVIASIAEGVIQFAINQVPVYDISGKLTGYKEMPDDTYTKASERIAKIITTIGGALVETYNGHSDLFQPLKVSESSAGGFLGLIGTSNVQYSNETIFDRIISSTGKLGSVIATIAQGIQIFASSSVPELDSKTGKPTDKLVSLDKPHFDKAQERISDIITFFGDKFDEIYHKHQKLFDDTLEVNTNFSVAGFFGIGGDLVETKHTDSPISRVINATSVIGSIITNIATSIALLHSLNIPVTDENGNTTLKPFTEADFTKTGNNLITLLTTILTAMSSASSLPIFNNTKPFDIIGKVIGQASSAIGTIANTIAMYSSMKFPTGEFVTDENGNKQPKFSYLSNEALLAAGKNMGEVIRCVLTGIIDSINNNEILKLFGVNNIYEYLLVYGKENAPAPPVLFAIEMINKVTTPLASLADTIMKLAGNTVVEKEFNADGTVKTSKVTVITPEAINKAKRNLKEIIMGIMLTVNDIWNKYDTLFKSIDKDNADNPIVRISNGIDSINSTVGSLYDTLNDIAKKDEENKQNKINLNSLINNIGSSLGFFGKVGKLFMSSDPNVWKDILGESWKSNFTYASLIDNANATFGSIQNANTVITITLRMFSKLVKDVLFTNISEIGTGWENLTNKNIILNNKQDIMNGISNILEIFESILVPFNSLYEKIKSIQYLSNYTTFSPILHKVDYIGQLIMKVIGWEHSIISKHGDFIKQGKMNPIMISASIQDFINAANKLKELTISGSFSGNFNISSVFNNLTTNADETISNANSDIDRFVEVINKIMEIGEKSGNIPAENYQRLGDGIFYITESINKIKTSKLLGQHAKQLEKYVKAVNNVQINKVSSLNKFVQGMNQLANKLGNLDKLTDAIANRLAEELKFLTQQLSRAAEVIAIAEETQEKRHILMEKESKNIKDLLSQKLTIDIKNISDMSGLSNSPSGGNNSTSQSSSGVSTDNSTSTDTSGGGGETTISGGAIGSVGAIQTQINDLFKDNGLAKSIKDAGISGLKGNLSSVKDLNSFNTWYNQQTDTNQKVISKHINTNFGKNSWEIRDKNGRELGYDIIIKDQQKK